MANWPELAARIRRSGRPFWGRARALHFSAAVDSASMSESGEAARSRCVRKDAQHGAGRARFRALRKEKTTERKDQGKRSNFFPDRDKEADWSAQSRRGQGCGRFLGCKPGRTTGPLTRLAAGSLVSLFSKRSLVAPDAEFASLIHPS